MKSKNDSCFLDEQKSNSSNNPSPKKEKKVIKSNSSSTNFQEKNNEKSQDPVDQEDFGDFNNFNISFYLPKDLRQNIEDDHDNPENKIESEGKNALGERFNSFLPNVDNNNENCINSNYNDNIDQTEIIMKTVLILIIMIILIKQKVIFLILQAIIMTILIS